MLLLEWVKEYFFQTITFSKRQVREIKLNFLKVVIEGLATLFRTLLTIILVFYFKSWGLIGFGLIQISYSLFIVSAYYIYFSSKVIRREISQNFPARNVFDFLPTFSKVNKFMISYYFSHTQQMPRNNLFFFLNYSAKLI